MNTRHSANTQTTNKWVLKIDGSEEEEAPLKGRLSLGDGMHEQPQSLYKHCCIVRTLWPLLPIRPGFIDIHMQIELKTILIARAWMPCWNQQLASLQRGFPYASMLYGLSPPPPSTSYCCSLWGPFESILISSLAVMWTGYELCYSTFNLSVI